LTGAILLCLCGTSWGAANSISAATQDCLGCHGSVHPGIIADWNRGRHAAISSQAAMQVKGLGLKFSSAQVPENLRDTRVGCAECHTLRADQHTDTFEHNGYRVHVVVSPDDCAVCHTKERQEYAKNIMAAAYGNLADNPLYNDLERSILGKSTLKDGQLHFDSPEPQTQADACYYCHGTRLKLSGTRTRETDAGALTFPVIKGWPNQGVGRINLDGSRGACTSCHPRHRFSIETARKPYTCKECHSGPDVPAYKVYSTSKHGNIFSTLESQWNFDHVPWVVGNDFSAPTCAACHISLVADADGNVINQRTHQMNDRLGWRIFGLIYAHPQPRSPDTTHIRNKVGLPLPTDLDGTPADDFLINAKEINARRGAMQATCRACHGTSWVESHFERLDHSISATNAQVHTATQLMQIIWQKGLAQGAANGGSLFDEYIERRWSDAWLLYANSTRFVSAMAGGGDYGVFDEGRYQLTQSIMRMQEWLDTRARLK
jgi:hypothetical protein